MSVFSTLRCDDAVLSVSDSGQGLPVVFQHGLGGDEAQVAQAFPDSPDVRRITVECRGHGRSSLGSALPFSLAMFAGDVLTAADQRGIGRFVAGGISMGAAIALHLARHHPDRVRALVLVRPAWTFSAAPANMAPIRTIAGLLAAHPLDKARDLFAASETAARLQVEAPDNLASLLGYFERPDAVAFADVLAGIAADGPGVTRREAERLTVPALIVGNRQDAVHPLAFASDLAGAIPGAVFTEVTAKAAEKTRHFTEIRASIATFLSSLPQTEGL